MLHSNLLSITKLIEGGFKVNFTKFGVKICRENGEVIAIGECVDNHFITRMTSITGNECNSID